MFDVLNLFVNWSIRSIFGFVFCFLSMAGALRAESDLVKMGNVLPGVDEIQLSSVEWESLGFSFDGQFFASMTYGVEHNLAEAKSYFFARLSIVQLRGQNDELVYERTLRCSGTFKKGLVARSIMQDLLRRESRELRKFQIEALEQGEILLSPKMGEKITELEKKDETKAGREEIAGTMNNPSNGSLANEDTNVLFVEMESNELNPSVQDNSKSDTFSILLEKLRQTEEMQSMVKQNMLNFSGILNRVYVITRNVNTTVFQLKQLRLDSLNSLRGQIIVLQSKGFPHKYVFQKNWNTLLQHNIQKYTQLILRPIFITLSPDMEHLLLTVQIHVDDMEEEKMAENTLTMETEFENNDNYAFATFSVQVY